MRSRWNGIPEFSLSTAGALQPAIDMEFYSGSFQQDLGAPATCKPLIHSRALSVVAVYITTGEGLKASERTTAAKALEEQILA